MGGEGGDRKSGQASVRTRPLRTESATVGPTNDGRMCLFILSRGTARSSCMASSQQVCPWCIPQAEHAIKSRDYFLHSIPQLIPSVSRRSQRHHISSGHSSAQSATFGQEKTNLGAKLGEFNKRWGNSIKFGRPEPAKTRPELGENLPTLAGNCPIVARNEPKLPRIQIVPNSAKIVPDTSRCGPSSTNSGPKSVKLGPAGGRSGGRSAGGR